MVFNIVFYFFLGIPKKYFHSILYISFVDHLSVLYNTIEDNNISYDEAVNIEIRKKYTESQEFSILRQKDEKPTEYQTYYEYCEKCKTIVKEKKAKHKRKLHLLHQIDASQ